MPFTMINDGIEVFLKRVDRPTVFKEYNHPEYERKFKTNFMHTYIEATDNERFTVQVKLTPDFNYFTSTGIQIRLYLDDNDEPDVMFHPKPEYMPRDGKMYTMRDFMSKVGNQWVNGDLAFGKLRVGESPSLFVKDDASEDMFVVRPPSDKLGTIRVSVQRGFEEGNRELTRRERATGYRPLTSQLGKEAAENSDVTHLIKTVNTRAIPAPKASTRFRALVGRNGDTYHFEFRYRSYEQLINLGIAPAQRPPPRPIISTPSQPRSQGVPRYAIDDEDDTPLPHSPAFRIYSDRKTANKPATDKKAISIKRERSELSPEASLEAYDYARPRKPAPKSQPRPKRKHPRLLDPVSHDEQLPSNNHPNNPSHLTSNEAPSSNTAFRNTNLPPPRYTLSAYNNNNNSTTTRTPTSLKSFSASPLFTTSHLPFHDSLTLNTRSTSLAPLWHTTNHHNHHHNHNRPATTAPAPSTTPFPATTPTLNAPRRSSSSSSSGAPVAGSGAEVGEDGTDGGITMAAAMALAEKFDFGAACGGVGEAGQGMGLDAGMGLGLGLGLDTGVGAEMDVQEQMEEEEGRQQLQQQEVQQQMEQGEEQQQMHVTQQTGAMQTEDEVAFALQEIELMEAEMALERRELAMKKRNLELRKRMAALRRGGGERGGE